MGHKKFIWLERLSALRTSLIRQRAAQLGIQAVHAEILEYLSRCNKYSNTAQALSEYLGITKGSISQSLKTLEQNGLIHRTNRLDDKRYYELSLSDKGQETLKKLQENIPDIPDFNQTTEDNFQSILKDWQHKNNFRSFGLCKTCKYKEILDNGTFKCGLTKENLLPADTEKICREHVFE